MENIEAGMSPEELVGHRVRAHREWRGWTQADLGKALGELGMPMTQTMIAKLERGKRPLRVNELAALARLLGFAPGALMTPESDPEHFALYELENDVRAFVAQVGYLSAEVSRLEEEVQHATDRLDAKRDELEDWRRRLQEKESALQEARRKSVTGASDG